MKTALVLSPFATWPTDVGHRRRTYQTTAMLRDAGYRVTFLLYAFEGGWYWRFQEPEYAEMRKQWDDVIVVQAEHSVGMPPREGRFHGLDEWWSTELESHLRNLFRHRHFDLFVVHNVWLSKALSLAPRATTTMLETHDLFWKRRALLDKLGIGHDFYEPEQGPEIFGMNRAQIAIAIQEKDARELLPHVGQRAVTVPFYDAAVEAEALPPRGYLHPHKVTFGFLGSAHTYNVAGMRAVLRALEERIQRNFAPVDIILGGTASQALETPLSVRRLGRVPTEAGFYAQCDIALAPTFEGTGFKIKVADMLALGMPSLVASHSAIGTALKGESVVETPEQMADAMIRIAQTRPPLATLRAPAIAARDDLKRRVELGRVNLFRMVQARKPCLIVDLSAFGPERGVVPLVSYLSLIRHLPAMASTFLVLRPDMLKRLGPTLPLGVRALTRQDVAAETQEFARRVFLDVSGSGLRWHEPEARDRIRTDGRWDWLAEAAPQPAPLIAFPTVYPDVHWDPCVAEIRRIRRDLPGTPPVPVGIQRMLFLDWVGQRAASPRASLARDLWLVNAQDPLAVEAAMLALLETPEGRIEVVWTCQGLAGLRRVVMEIAASRRHRVSGFLDGTFHGPANLQGLAGNADQRLQSGAASLFNDA